MIVFGLSEVDAEMVRFDLSEALDARCSPIQLLLSWLPSYAGIHFWLLLKRNDCFPR